MIPYLKRGKHVVTMIIYLSWAVILIILGEYQIWTISYGPWSSNMIWTYRNDSPDADACYSKEVAGHVSQAAKRAKSRPIVESPQKAPQTVLIRSHSITWLSCVTTVQIQDCLKPSRPSDPQLPVTKAHTNVDDKAIQYHLLSARFRGLAQQSRVSDSAVKSPSTRQRSRLI